MPEKRGIEKYLRPDLAGFGGYSAHTSPETLDGKVEVPVGDIIKLDANENVYGCSPRVNAALAACRTFNIYPDNGQEKLRKQLAGYAGIGPEHIVAANGSNQLIDLIFRLLLAPGDEVVTCVPTFGIFRFSAELCGGKLVAVPRNGDFSVNVSAVKAACTSRTKLIVLVNPNNPTGTPVLREDILSLLGTGLPVLVDEAYYEFSGETVAPLVPEYGNLMVLRTFSKWAGLAGLRIGYGLFPEAFARLIIEKKIPYIVIVAALVAAEESLKDIDYLMSTVEKIKAERGRLFAALQTVDWLRPYPTSANFILCRVMKGEAKTLKERLEKKGILIRYFDEPVLRDCVRFSVGKPEHTDALIDLLRAM
jgi:histidinol-phosphate aminotransferase